MCAQVVNRMEDALKKITKDNVAYFVKSFKDDKIDIAQTIYNVDCIGYGFDEDEVYKYLLKPLAERADELGIQLSNTSASQEAESRIDNLQAMKNQINYLYDWIIKKEESLGGDINNLNTTSLQTTDIDL